VDRWEISAAEHAPKVTSIHIICLLNFYHPVEISMIDRSLIARVQKVHEMGISREEAPGTSGQHWDLFWAIDPLIGPVNKRLLAIELLSSSPLWISWKKEHKLIARKSCIRPISIYSTVFISNFYWFHTIYMLRMPVLYGLRAPRYGWLLFQLWSEIGFVGPGFQGTSCAFICSILFIASLATPI